MNSIFKPIISNQVKESIKEYCAKRRYKCKGCRYSIKFILPDYEGFATCIFSNCPCDWKIEKEEL